MYSDGLGVCVPIQLRDARGQGLRFIPLSPPQKFQTGPGTRAASGVGVEGEADVYKECLVLNIFKSALQFEHSVLLIP